MTSPWWTLRRRVLTPSASETLLDKRGFHRKSPAAQDLLVTVDRSFLERTRGSAANGCATSW